MQALDELKETKRLLDIIGSSTTGGSVVKARAAALAEIETLRAKVVEDRDAVRAVQEEKDLEGALFEATDKLQALKDSLLAASKALR
jgi:hypothetical protein